MLKLFFFFSIFSSSLFCQSLKLGGNANVGMNNKNLQYIFGAEIQILYQLNENFDVGANYSASLTQLEGKLGDYSGVLSKLGVSLFYYPFNVKVRPYISLGINYNINSVNSDGLHPYGTSTLYNSLGYETRFGIIQKIKKMLELNLGFEYNYQNLSYSFNSYSEKTIKSSENKYAISSFSIYIGLIFTL